MRTKALMCLAALAAGTAISMAQSNVYSLNIVGYMNYTQPANTFKIITNPLNTTNNDVSNIFAGATTAGYFGTQIYKRNSGGGYDSVALDPDAGGWTGPMAINPGDGVWLATPPGIVFTNTFVGEVLLNSTNNLPPGYKIVGSAVPQTGRVQTDLGLPGAPGDGIFIWNGGGYDPYSYDPDVGGWSPFEPTNNAGEAFWFYNAGAAKDWVRNFNPGP